MRSGKMMPPVLIRGERLMRSYYDSDLLLCQLYCADTPAQDSGHRGTCINQEIFLIPLVVKVDMLLFSNCAFAKFILKLS